MLKSYAEFVQQLVRWLEEARQLPLGTLPPPAHPALPPQAPKALIFSPHPDDEVIIGALPLRLRRELHFNVINVAVTQGSNRQRQAERLHELQNCCQHIGFSLIQTAPSGLEGVNLPTRQGQPAAWEKSVQRIAALLREHQPQAIFVPHARDWNSTHIGTHHLVLDALAHLPPTFQCHFVETEFWGAMDHPNLMVESSPRDLVDLITALTFHIGEVRRNPYHLRLPAWMMDNVRRGGELVGGQGTAAPNFNFATLYRLRRWRAGALENVLDAGRFVSVSDDMAGLFAI